jgi:hypothetical protein
MLERRIVYLIEQYVDGVISIQEFSPGFAALYFAARQERNAHRSPPHIAALHCGGWSIV